jgi:uncharacterized protein YjiS (DUF1127 family)
MVTILKQTDIASSRSLSQSKDTLRATPLYQIWFARLKQRRQLARLSDVMLKDIGISRSDAAAEISKPFWKE